MRQTFDVTLAWSGDSMDDDFWSRDNSTEPLPVERAVSPPERDLTRDEIVVSEAYGGWMGERMRDAGFFQYVAIKRAGVVGKIVVSVILAGILFAQQTTRARDHQSRGLPPHTR